MAQRRRDAPSGQIGLFEEARLFALLSDQQEQLVSTLVAQAAQAEAAARQRDELRRDLEGSLDRLQEVHHRIRNHLQTVTGLLSAQELSESSPSARRALQQSVARLTSIAAIHDLLARDPTSGELRLSDLAERLARHLLHQAGAERRLRVRCSLAPVSLRSREATSFVLVLTELLSNAIEHAFPADGEGDIQVTLTCEARRALLEVSDNGRGLPEGFDPKACESLGMRLASRLAERDLAGSLESWSDGGARFRISFPLPAEEEAP